jgi:RNA polymerase sigma-70 factor (ECF subfamily)
MPCTPPPATSGTPTGPRSSPYDQLVRLDPSPIVALNRAIAIAELDGPEVALAAVDRLEVGLADYHAFHVTRADLLRRLGRDREAWAAYDQAIELAGNTAETAYLTRRRDELTHDDAGWAPRGSNPQPTD